MADIHTFEGEDIVETLAAHAEGHEPGELGALARAIAIQLTLDTRAVACCYSKSNALDSACFVKELPYG